MEATEEVFDDELVRILLIGSEEELAQGLTLIDRHLRRRICAWVRKQRWAAWMKSEDLADTWQETLIAIWEAVKARRFDENRPLIPWVKSIARNSALDRCRRKSSAERALITVGETLRGTQSGTMWQTRMASERREILAWIREVITKLPEKQQRAMQVFIDGYPDTKDMQTLRAEVSKASSQEETLAAVKRALQEAREKVRELLKTKGFEIGK